MGTRQNRPGQRRVDPKRIAREQRLVRQRRVALLRLALVAFVAFALIAGFAALYRSDALAIEQVTVTGNVELSAEQVREAASLPDDATLLRFPKAEIEERLGAHPWIADARVSRDFPDGLTVTIVERVPVAFLDTGDATLWLIDSGAFVIDSRIPSQEDALVVIRDVEDLTPVIGEVVDSEVLDNALEVLAGLSDELRAAVRAVSAPSIDRNALITTDGVEVLVGSSDDIALKDAVALRILSEQAGRAVYVNVRTPDRPTWRGLETSQ